MKDPIYTVQSRIQCGPKQIITIYYLFRLHSMANWCFRMDYYYYYHCLRASSVPPRSHDGQCVRAEGRQNHNAPKSNGRTTPSIQSYNRRINGQSTINDNNNNNGSYIWANHKFPFELLNL